MAKQIAFLVIFLEALAAPQAAWAGEKEEARKHYDRAIELVDDGQLEEAIVEFRRSYDLTHHFAVLYNIGQVFVALAKPVEAVDAYQRYLAQGANKVPADRRVEVEKEITRQKAHLATLEILAARSAASDAGVGPCRAEGAGTGATGGCGVSPAAGDGGIAPSSTTGTVGVFPAGPSAAPSAVPRAREAKTRPHERAGLDEPSAADTSEHGHLGLVLSLVKARASSGSGALWYGLGFRVGYRPLPSGEIGVLVAAWGEAGSLTVDAIPILFQFNAIAPLTPILSFFGGGQIGLLHYRLNTSGMYSDRGIVGLNAFACGLQAGGDVRLTSYLSLRLELAWLYANEASTTFSDSFSTDTYSWEANNIFHASAAFCLTF